MKAGFYNTRFCCILHYLSKIKIYKKQQKGKYKMKRSEINKILREADEFFKKMNFRLPPFAYFTKEEWEQKIKSEEYSEIIDNSLGWDITDFGSGDYEKIGLFLFTVRNGNYGDAKYPKPYAEKIMIVKENQITPYHFHTKKMEDIINRGGGNLLIKLYNSDSEKKFANSDVTIYKDGRKYSGEAGSIVVLTPGESITLTQGLYHQFWGEEGSGKVLVGEVSQVNDDRTDNCFYKPAGRFPAILEDEPPLYLLGQDLFSINHK